MNRESKPELTREDRETGRIEAFSDGVFAIAITLLVLDLKVPRAIREPSTLANSLMAQWPTFAAYLTSFITIGIAWINHHQLFTVIRRVDHTLLILNLLLLLMMTFVPFPTSLLAEYFGHSGEFLAAQLYAATFFLGAVFFNLLWRHASRHRLLSHQADQELVSGISKSYSLGPVLYLIILAVSFWSVEISVLMSFALALFFALPKRAVVRRLPTKPSQAVQKDYSAPLQDAQSIPNDKVKSG